MEVGEVACARMLGAGPGAELERFQDGKTSIKFIVPLKTTLSNNGTLAMFAKQ